MSIFGRVFIMFTFGESLFILSTNERGTKMSLKYECCDFGQVPGRYLISGVNIRPTWILLLRGGRNGVISNIWR